MSRALWEYNALDSAVTIECFHSLLHDLGRQGNLETYKRQSAILEPLLYMMARGLRVNTSEKERKSKEAGEEISRLTEQFHSLCGSKVDPNSPKQLMEYFYVKKGIKPYINRKTHKPTTDEDALKRISAKGFEEARVLLEIRSLTKLKGTYFDAKLSADGRLRCFFNPGKTVSGRLSSGTNIFGEGTNLQNQPPEMKELIIADEGYVLYQIDESQGENRIVAYIAPEPLMIAAFENGRDIHRQTAGLIFGKDPKEISDEKGSSSIGGGRYSERFWGKKANHGLNYALGYKSFAMYYEIPEAEAKAIVDAYHRAYPGVRQYHQWVVDQLRVNRTITNPFGRRRTFLDRWGDTMFKEAYSYIPQSTIADIINERGLCYVYYNEDEVDLLNQVHDSIIFQIPISLGWEKHSEIINRIVKSLAQPITWRGREFVIPSDVSVGNILGKQVKAKQLTAAGIEEAFKKSKQH